MSETSWKDNVDWKQEYAENDKWSDDLKLPHRRVPVRFGRAPDYTDANFDWEHPGSYFKARIQRANETFIATEEMKMLQDQIADCYRKNTIDHVKYCRHLSQEYLKRIRCPNYICDPTRLASTHKKYSFYNKNTKQPLDFQGVDTSTL